MNWLELSFHSTHEAYDLVSNIFIEAGSKGVLLEDSNTVTESHEDHFGEIYRLNPNDYPSDGVIIKGYLAVTSDIETQLEFVRTQLLNLKFDNFDHNKLEIKMLDEEDWANSWKKHYTPIEITKTLVIKPCWLEPTTDPNVTEIMLDPGMAFGSGTHETTQLCLELIEQYANSSQVVVDVGTGSGILAIAASKLGCRLVYAVDLDAMAVIRAKENIEMNHCQNIIIEKNNLIDGVEALSEAPTLMVANILAPIIINMLDDVVKVLPQGQTFICSGIVDHEKQAVLDALVAYQFKIEEVREKNGWVAIVATYEG
ncbi:ribosomal protein L11 methyltransferase [Turicibacter sp. HGF1]|uniref:50S ribosomal protein L11 methyltransferase n=1 Tax=Turicibacter sp. HGF1 TaxID=910310 RepID=UPI0001FDB3B2|nr:50S ribosomal protein L11 methyltransferase [Turicibacter sp. HGF1]EGC91228.1 ribosomal protein L11 methyltransferase [Turicibacter sp. HGF1]